MNKLFRYAGIAYLVYLGLALLIVTPLLNFLPHKYVRDNYDRELDTRFVWFNPFSLSLDIHEGALPETSGEPFVSLDKASVNLSLASLWQEGIVFDRIQLAGLEAHVQRLDAERFNFSDFVPAGEEEPATAEAVPDAAPLGVTIGDLDLTANAIKVTDLHRDEPFSTQWENLEIHAVDFSTVLREGKPYRLTLSDEAGGSLLWEGNVSVAEGASDGKLTLQGLRLLPLWRFAKPWVQFEVHDGLLDAAVPYQVSWAGELAYSIAGGQVSLRQLDLRPKAGVDLPDTAVSLAGLSIDDVGVESTTTAARVGRVALDGLDIAGFSEGASVSLQTLFTPQLPETDPVDPASSDQPAAWTAQVGRIELNNSAVQWRSEFTNPPTARVSNINIAVDNVSWPLAGESTIALTTTLNDTAAVTADGTADLGTGAADIQYTLSKLSLPWFNPALPDAFKAQLTGGEVSSEGSVSLADFTPASAGLGATISGFGMRQNDAEQQFTGWDKLSLEGLALDFTGQGVVLQKLTVDALQGRVHIAKDGSLNTSNLWQPDDDAAGEETTAQAAPAPASDTGPDVDEGDSAEPWSIDIPTVQLRKAAIDFQDDSLPIEFRTLVGDLSGFIEGLSSDPQRSAKVDIKGSVDGYAPVSLAGTLNALASPPALDLTLRFDGVDLARVTPYSGTYAGYAIDRGLLDLDLAYTLKDNRLVGKNQVVIDQLKLGESVQSDKALDIPLKLGISLLTNASGVIDMKIPVSGNIDDPSFKLSSVIASAFVNLITKAVTAPFSLLANLVSSDEDLQHITFPPGGTTLSDASVGKLAQLADALKQRPALSLAVVGQVHSTEDRQALQNAALTQALLAGGLSQSSIDNRDEAWAAAISARNAQPVNAAGEPLTLQEQLQQALAAFAIDDAALLSLAEARATAVKSYLLNDAGLAPDRAVIEKAALEDQERDFNGVELLLEN